MRCNLSVGSHGIFCQNVRSFSFDVMKEDAVYTVAFFPHKTRYELDTGFLQKREATSGYQGIGVI